VVDALRPCAVARPGRLFLAGLVSCARNAVGDAAVVGLGDEFLLLLGTDLDWTLAPIDQAIIQLVPGITVVRGAQGIFEAVGAGTTKLSATGDPPCRKVTPPCGAPSILFEVTLVVSLSAPSRCAAMW
jgi:hypothetical protein